MLLEAIFEWGDKIEWIWPFLNIVGHHWCYQHKVIDNDCHEPMHTYTYSRLLTENWSYGWLMFTLVLYFQYLIYIQY